MPNPQTRPLGYHMGKALGSCMRCGQTKFTSELQLEWSGSRVCQRCWDPRPDQMSPPNVYPEGLPVPDASPFPGYSFVPVPSFLTADNSNQTADTTLITADAS